jgi:hypothetical protein
MLIYQLLLTKTVNMYIFLRTKLVNESEDCISVDVVSLTTEII